MRGTAAPGVGCAATFATVATTATRRDAAVIVAAATDRD
jgi:hypothetical protein